MVMSLIWTAFLTLSLVCALITGRGAQLSAAAAQGAQAGITLGISMAGSMCLWTGAGKVMEKVGVTQRLSRLLRPILTRLFPESKGDSILAGALSANVCANLLGLGNAATPMGIQAARRLAGSATDGRASHSLCRLIVLNTASIQLIPTTVAALRAGAGSAAPFDILPAVWITSLCSAGLGLAAAWIMKRIRS